MQFAECRLNLLRSAALLVDGENPLLKIDAGLDRSKDIVRGPKDSAEQAEFLAEEFENTTINFIALVEKVYNHDIELLTIAVAAANPLFDALRIPGQIVIDNKGTELQVDAFRRGFSGEEDCRIVTEMLDQRGPNIHTPGTGGAACVPVLL